MQNILMIHMESWDGRMLGCQGYHPAMKEATPNIDALAALGTRFANAYCTNPICCPSRANMLSGTYTHECESWNNFKGLETGYQPPQTTKTFIREYFMGEKLVGETVGNSMQVFLLDIPRLEFAAIIPKGDYVSICLLGEDIDTELVNNFLESPQVRACMPPDWQPACKSCQCSPKINIQGAIQPFADRMVFVGDCGVTRLYKDGIGAAYKTAKACATTAVFQGISAAAFEHHFWPVCQSISRDNSIGKATFAASTLLQHARFARRAVLRMTRKEQELEGSHRDMSQVLWDMFTGSAPYQEILTRAVHPRFIAKLGWELLTSPLPKPRIDAT